MYLTAKAFSKECGLSEWTIHKLCREGKIPFIPAGRRKMIHRERGFEALDKLEHEDHSRDND